MWGNSPTPQAPQRLLPALSCDRFSSFPNSKSQHHNLFIPDTTILVDCWIMGHSKAHTTYYSSLHNSITSLCKSVLPLGLKKRCLVSAEYRLWKLQSDNLKWQQESFNQMLKLMGLQQNEILPEAEVSAFRTHLLDTLLSSPPPQQDHPLILRDKLLFLQVCKCKLT